MEPMAQKVTVTGDVGMGMKVSHTFERVVDSPDDAEQFGEDASQLFTSFQEGFGKVRND